MRAAGAKSAHPLKLLLSPNLFGQIDHATGERALGRLVGPAGRLLVA
jgi:hypothetical protein